MTVKASYSLAVDWNGNSNLDDDTAITSTDLIETTIERGFSDPLARMAYTGRATFTVQNLDQTYSPPLNSSQLVPMRQVRFRMTFESTTVVLFRGYLFKIQSVPAVSGPPNKAALHCVDASALFDLVRATIPAQLNANARTVLIALVNAVYTSPVGLNFQNGINTFAISADRWSLPTTAGGRYFASNNAPSEEVTASSKIIDTCASDWGRFFIAKNGQPVFVNRHDQVLNTAIRLSAHNTMHGLEHERTVEDIVNSVDVVYAPRVVGAIDEVLGTLSPGTAPAIGAGLTETFTIRFRDPSNPSLPIGAYGLDGLVAGRDYVATDDEAGEGIDRTSQVSAVMTVEGADSAEIEVTNNDGATVYLQKLVVRGRGVRTRREERAHAEDAASIAAYARRHATINAPLMSNHGQAQLLADYLVDLYKDPIERVSGIRIYANQSATMLRNVRDLELLQPVSITESHLGLNTYQGLVYQMSHHIRHLESHELTIAIHKPYFVENPVRLDVTTFALNHTLMY